MNERKVTIFTIIPTEGDKTPITIMMSKQELEEHIQQLGVLLNKFDENN